MTPGLEAVVGQLFDYAGMHPPANLTMTQALAASGAFPKSLRRPHLVAADLVVGMHRLGDLEAADPVAAGFHGGRRMRVAVLDPAPLGSGVHPTMVRARLVEVSKGPPGLDPVTYEVRLEKTAAQETGSWTPHAQRLGVVLGPLRVSLFIEPDFSGESFPDRLGVILDALAQVNAGLPAPGVGLKVRGSGPSALDNPRLALLVAETARRGLPLKATAGLHHPILEPDRYANALGFLNLTCALILARSLGETFSQRRALECLETREAADYSFSGGLRWRDLSLDLAALRDAKESSPFSIGSCSLSEPDADLVRLFGP